MGLAYFGIKLGSKGCYATDFIRERYIECPRGIRAVDTTGAGDSFMAGLMAGLVNGLSFLKVLDSQAQLLPTVSSIWGRRAVYCPMKTSCTYTITIKTKIKGEEDL